MAGAGHVQQRLQGTVPAGDGPLPIIKEQRSELVKHHLRVLWTDYFKPPHFEKYPQLHTLFKKDIMKAHADVAGPPLPSSPLARRCARGVEPR